MHTPTHALLSWLCAELGPFERRDRALVFAAGVLPDLDGLSILGGVELYRRWHHVLLHNLAAALVVALALAAFARRRLWVFALALLAFHLHLICDYLGSAAPPGSAPPTDLVWSIPYLQPFSAYDFKNPYQWPLASWQNTAVTVAAILTILHIGARRGRSPVEVFSKRADAAVVEVLRRRWPLYQQQDSAPEPPDQT